MNHTKRRPRPATAGRVRSDCSCGGCWCSKREPRGLRFSTHGEVGVAHIPRPCCAATAAYDTAAAEDALRAHTFSVSIGAGGGQRAATARGAAARDTWCLPGGGFGAPAAVKGCGAFDRAQRLASACYSGGGLLTAEMTARSLGGGASAEGRGGGGGGGMPQVKDTRLRMRFGRSRRELAEEFYPVSVAPPATAAASKCTCSSPWPAWLTRREAVTRNPLLPKHASLSAVRIGC